MSGNITSDLQTAFLNRIQAEGLPETADAETLLKQAAANEACAKLGLGDFKRKTDPELKDLSVKIDSAWAAAKTSFESSASTKATAIQKALNDYKTKAPELRGDFKQEMTVKLKEAGFSPSEILRFLKLAKTKKETFSETAVAVFINGGDAAKELWLRGKVTTTGPGGKQTQIEEKLEAVFFRHLQKKGLPRNAPGRDQEKQKALEEASKTLKYDFVWRIKETPKGKDMQARIDRAWKNAIKEFERDAAQKVRLASKALQEYYAVHEAKGEIFEDKMGELLAGAGFTDAEIEKFFALSTESLALLANEKTFLKAVDIWVKETPFAEESLANQTSKELGEIQESLGISEETIIADIVKDLNPIQQKKLQELADKEKERGALERIRGFLGGPKEPAPISLKLLQRFLGAVGLDKKLQPLRDLAANIKELEKTTERAAIEQSLAAMVNETSDSPITVATLYKEQGAKVLNEKVQILQGKTPTSQATKSKPITLSTGNALKATIIQQALQKYNPDPARPLMDPANPQSFVDVVTSDLKSMGFSITEIHIVLSLPTSALEMIRKNGAAAADTWTKAKDNSALELKNLETIRKGGKDAEALYAQFQAPFGLPAKSPTIINKGGEAAVAEWTRLVSPSARQVTQDINKFSEELGLSTQDIVKEVMRQLPVDQQRKLKNLAYQEGSALPQEGGKRTAQKSLTPEVSIHLLERFLGPAELHNKLQGIRDLAQNVQNFESRYAAELQKEKKSGLLPQEEMLLGAMSALPDSDFEAVKKALRPGEVLSIAVLARQLGGERLNSILSEQPIGEARKAAVADRALQAYNAIPENKRGPFRDFITPYLRARGFDDVDVAKFFALSQQELTSLGAQRREAVVSKAVAAYKAADKTERGSLPNFVETYLLDRGFTGAEAAQFRSVSESFTPAAPLATTTWAKKHSITDSASGRVVSARKRLETLGDSKETIVQNVRGWLSKEQNDQIDQLAQKEGSVVSLNLLERFLGPAKLAEQLEAIELKQLGTPKEQQLRSVQEQLNKANVEMTAMQKKLTANAKNIDAIFNKLPPSERLEKAKAIIRTLRRTNSETVAKEIVTARLTTKESLTPTTEQIRRAMSGKTHREIIEERLEELTIPAEESQSLYEAAVAANRPRIRYEELAAPIRTQLEGLGFSADDIEEILSTGLVKTTQLNAAVKELISPPYNLSKDEFVKKLDDELSADQKWELDAIDRRFDPTAIAMELSRRIGPEEVASKLESLRRKLAG